MKLFVEIGALFIFLLGSCITETQESKTKIKVLSESFLGNAQRNFYGNLAPEKLDTLWRLHLGEGVSPAYGNPNKIWKGAGWTGQPLLVQENDSLFLIQGAFDYHLKKINAETGKLVWQCEFDDILKGTGTIYENVFALDEEDRFVIIQGSRRGVKNTIDSKYCLSIRAISYSTGKELWRMNVKRTLAYSRDVDGSALVLGDTAYLALENGLFTVFAADPANLEMLDGILQPKIHKEIKFYNDSDTLIHGGNIESESSPCYLNGRIYTTAGSGRVYGYNIRKGLVDWIFEIGSDLNGSPTVTSDSCLIIPVEKQYIQGHGGVFKLDPSKVPEESVVWYFPTQDSAWFHWKGGLVGSVAVNDFYNQNDNSNLAAIIGVDAYLYVVDHKQVEVRKQVHGPNREKYYPTPKLVFKSKIGGTIATPIIVGNKLIAPLDNGLYLYEYNSKYEFTLLDQIDNIQLDATPVVWDSKLYVASLDGYLYCFGKK